MNHTSNKSAEEISRRRFLTVAGASAVTLAALPSALAAETGDFEAVQQIARRMTSSVVACASVMRRSTSASLR